MATEFSIITLGCKVNQYESQAIREAWLSMGFVDGDAPSLYLVNSCAVTASAVAELRQLLRRLRRSSSADIILTGCAALQPDLPPVSAVVHPRRKDALLRWPLSEEAAFPPDVLSYTPLSITTFQRSRPVVKVQDGCSHRCTYCIVPSCRGPAVSRPVPEIVAEIDRLFRAGFTEVMLSGINLRQYEPSFWGMIRTVERSLASKWRGRTRIRLSSLDPAQLTDEGIETLACSTMLCRHLHLSLQSASRTVLRRMGRPHYAPADVSEALRSVRSFWPVFGLGADLLTGFPGESEAEFRETFDFVASEPFTYAHVFPYSERPGTVAAGMRQLPRVVRRGRAAALRDLASRKRTAFYASLVGKDAVAAHVADEGGLLEWYVPCRCPSSPALVSVRVVASDDRGVTAVPR